MGNRSSHSRQCFISVLPENFTAFFPFLGKTRKKLKLKFVKQAKIGKFKVLHSENAFRVADISEKVLYKREGKVSLILLNREGSNSP